MLRSSRHAPRTHAHLLAADVERSRSVDFPMPADTVTSTSRQDPVRASASHPVSAPNSDTRPTKGAACVPLRPAAPPLGRGVRSTTWQRTPVRFAPPG